MDEAVRRKVSGDRPESIMAALVATGDAYVIHSHRFHFFPGFYNREHCFGPRKETCEIVHLGRTSFRAEHTSTSTKTGACLSSSSTLLVLVNLLTRQGAVIPEEIRSASAGKIRQSPSKGFSLFSQPPPTIKSYICPVTVPAAHIDFQQHANQAAYIVFCHDSASTLCRNGQFQSLKGDLAFYQMTTMECIYQEETYLGDEVDVHVWEEEAADGGPILHFIIEKEGRSVFQSLMQFDIAISPMAV